jgi:hypothetical protein
MGEKTGVSLSLERKQLDWLEIMSKKYGLPTPGTDIVELIVSVLKKSSTTKAPCMMMPW